MPAPLPQWDLSDLYTGLDDPAIARDTKKYARRAKKFHDTYAHAITSESPIQEIQSAVAEYEKILVGAAKLSVFAGLNFSTAKHDHSAAAFAQSISEWSASLQSELLFFDLLISSLPNEKLTMLREHASFKNWHHWLLRQAQYKKHRLTEKEEALLLETSLTGREAFVRLYEQEDARREFSVTEKGKKKHVHETELLSRLHHGDREVRKAASASLNSGLAADIDRLAFIYNMITQDTLLTAKRRNFAEPEGIRHLGNQLTAEAVEALVSTVTGHYALVHDYYSFKRKHLKYSALYEYDRYAPVATSTKRYTYEEAKNIVLESFESFSPVFRKTAELFFDNNWIDAKPRKGKAGGAFCSYATPDSHPYILMNFNGTMNDVMTLAHELGHGIHAYLAKKQSYLHYDWPISIAEIASIFAEMVVFNSLKETLSHHQQFALHALKVEGIIASVFRQVAMFEFEREAHSRRREGELSPAELNGIWKEKFAAMYGTAVKQSKGSEVQWSLIPHLFQWPFYVYSYAFGDLLTRSLAAAYQENPGTFVPAYLDMLASGGSKSPGELLSAFNADIEKRSFWESGMKEVKQLIEETKSLA